MSKLSLRVEKVIIPTYEVGDSEALPIFAQKRVYQGSSGKVYPYAVTETISDTKADKEYEAVILENEYLYVMVLPALGGRIQRARDKTNNYDFVYYNSVIKPALVGLAGPWISGGIEFNWPQHHRPTTFMSVDYTLKEEDGRVSVLLHDVDKMYGTTSLTRISLYKGKAYIEVSAKLYNPTPFAQTFLWWANPAVAANDFTQTVFPPDVHAVMDHGKRDVAEFPIAHSTYYKHDYSAGVDISRYKNIPVPTSFMAAESAFDFMGGYDYQKEAGLLHIADHHISPGKKQWTWGCGDFGKAWDRNLSDTDGPYVELMAGVYTDNQPDFSHLAPFETKSFTQYFLPYKKVGAVKNATIDAAVNMEKIDGKLCICAYATQEFKGAKITLEAGGKTVFETVCDLSPTKTFKTRLEGMGEEGTIRVTHGERVLVSFKSEKETPYEIPKSAKRMERAADIKTNEELFLAGAHLEQYRHATYKSEDYYLEGLRRDKGDIRINNAYGTLLCRRARFSDAKGYFEAAIKRLTERNPNPYDSEVYYNLGLCEFYLKNYSAAYDTFYKATWSAPQKGAALYRLACIDCACGRFEAALEMIEAALDENPKNALAHAARRVIARKCNKALPPASDAFDIIALFEAGEEITQSPDKVLCAARLYMELGCLDEAASLLSKTQKTPLTLYYKAYCLDGEECEKALYEAEAMPPDGCFPAAIEDAIILESLIERFANLKRAPLYLGNFYYDKREHERAIELWESALKAGNGDAVVLRNLALGYYNNRRDADKAYAFMERAFLCDTHNARIFMELDCLREKIAVPFNTRLLEFERYKETFTKRDDMCVSYASLLNATGRAEKAYRFLMSRTFHPWEGGEGKVSCEYKYALIAPALKADNAEDYLNKALFLPHSLGEGKLEGTKDNEVHFLLGCAYEKKGDKARAAEHFEMAKAVDEEISQNAFYNDQPPETLFFAALAHRKTGEEAEAKRYFKLLRDYGEKHEREHIETDYFAVSLPDMTIFEEDSDRKNTALCFRLQALAAFGEGDADTAQSLLARSMEVYPSACGAFYQKLLKSNALI